MITNNNFWDDFVAELSAITKPNSELKYRLYYNPETMQGEIITMDELDGEWVEFPKENIGFPPMDWHVTKDGKIKRIIEVLPKQLKLKKGGNTYFTLKDDWQIIVDSNHPDAQGWSYG